MYVKITFEILHKSVSGIKTLLNLFNPIMINKKENDVKTLCSL